MIKAIKELGLSKSVRFFCTTLAKSIFNCLLFSPLRLIFLKLFGSTINEETIINQIKFTNLYRIGFKGLKIGSSCFLADDVLLDLADKIVIEDNVTLAARVTVLTHTNVGYNDHPLQKSFPSFSKPVKIEKNCFIGAGAIILPGVTIKKNSFIAAGSLVTKSIPSYSLAVGVPAKVIRKIK
jgi:acetyltransferase-like isoleucine patch superfamily enzyme